METRPYILPHCLRDEFFCLGLSAVVLFTGNLAACEQVVAEVGGGITALFGNSITLKNFAKRSEDNLHIAKEGNSLDVFKIVADFSFPGNGIASADLREAAESLTHGVALALLRCHKDHVAHELGPRPDYGHITFKDVEQLGEFVEAGASNEFSVLCQALFVWQELSVSVFLAGHGAELNKLEDFLVLAGAGLREEGVALHLDGAEDGQHNENRAQAEDRRERAEEVQNSLEEVRVHYATALDGTMSLPFGSVIPMQAWLRHSPSRESSRCSG